LYDTQVFVLLGKPLGGYLDLFYKWTDPDGSLDKALNVSQTSLFGMPIRVNMVGILALKRFL
jgi:hypothetical protein